MASLIREAKKRFAKKEEEKSLSEQQALSDLGLKIIKNETLDKRIMEFEEFHSYVQSSVGDTTMVIDKDGNRVERKITPEEKVNFLVARINGINRRLNRMSVPWGRAADSGWYAEAMSGWSVIYSRILDMAQSVYNLMNVKEQKAWMPHIDKEVLAQKFQWFFETYYIQYALKIAMISYSGVDVTPSPPVVIKPTYPPQMFGETVTERVGEEREEEE